MDLALSREVNRQGQRNRAITLPFCVVEASLYISSFQRLITKNNSYETGRIAMKLEVGLAYYENENGNPSRREGIIDSV